MSVCGILILLESLIDGLHHILSIMGTSAQHEFLRVLFIPDVVCFNFATPVILIVNVRAPVILVHAASSIFIDEVE